MNILGKKIILRAMEKEDCAMARAMFNDPELENSVVGWAFPLSQYSQEMWFSSHYHDSTNLRFIIESKESEPLGIVTLTDIDWKNRHATHGIKLSNTKFHAKGIGTDSVMAIMRYVFDELQLNRLNASWLDDNEASKQLHKKCGFCEEGKQRQYIFKHGKYHDLVIAGILSSEYHALIEKNHYWDEL